MSGTKVMLKLLVPLAAIITFLHLVIFIQYPATPGASNLTIYGEYAKMTLPLLLLITLIPKIHTWLDSIVTKYIPINLSGLVFLFACLGLQIANVPGQAWATLTFTTAIILLLYNYLRSNHTISQTLAITLSFMTVWLGWVLFEVIYQTGLWIYYPETWESNIRGFIRTMITMAQWALPAAAYIYVVTKRPELIKADIQPKLTTRVNKLTIILLAVCTIATILWFSRGMLVPIPIGADSKLYTLEINYWTIRHLDFSISRLSQISMIMATASILKIRSNR